MSFVPAVALALFGAQVPSPTTADPDRDRDGLSDFHETHKYGTDPAKADSDGDGVPDGDWEERREYAYTVRSIVQVLPPVTKDVLCDDYQDARILEERAEYVELEVVHYPLNTVATAIAPDPRWRETARKMTEWTKPGPTANWDEGMRKELVAALAKDGIRVEELDDKTLVERASKWLLQHARSVDGFTTFCSTFENGRARIHPGLEAAAERESAEQGLTVDEQWQRELFAKGMFDHGRRGSCTSTAIYLNGCLRALGVPTRIVLCIPVVDASDEREIEFLHERIAHARVRSLLERALPLRPATWTSHTFNEVFVGGRWRRLNGELLGQNILDSRCLGLMTHVATFGDWADGEMARTWGRRHAYPVAKDDPFGGSNPYSTVMLSDRLGVHAAVPPGFDASVKTLDHVAWSNDIAFDAFIRELYQPPVLFAHVVERDEFDELKQFMQHADLLFHLEAKGHPTLEITSSVGGVTQGDECWIVLRTASGAWDELVPGVAYTLRPRNSKEDRRWSVPPDAPTLRAAK